MEGVGVVVKKVGLGRGAAQGKGRAKKRRRCPDLRGWTLDYGACAAREPWKMLGPAGWCLCASALLGSGAEPFAAQWCFSREACEDRGVCLVARSVYLRRAKQPPARQAP